MWNFFCASYTYANEKTVFRLKDKICCLAALIPMNVKEPWLDLTGIIET